MLFDMALGPLGIRVLSREELEVIGLTSAKDAVRGLVITVRQSIQLAARLPDRSSWPAQSKLIDFQAQKPNSLEEVLL